VTASVEAGRRARFKFNGLRGGVHVAFADNRLVVLDVEHDRYLRIDRTRALAAAEVLQVEAFDRVWAALDARGLTRNIATESNAPWRSSLGPQKLSPFVAARVIGACRWAARTLRRKPFAQVLRAVQVRAPREPDPPALDRAVRAFLVHRPFYPRDYACMFEALALLRYLAVRGFVATWVFGVRGAPFSAHCWLEHGGVVLNDDPDAVRAYTPIMGV
jgi:hypothetical protein